MPTQFQPLAQHGKKELRVRAAAEAEAAEAAEAAAEVEAEDPWVPAEVLFEVPYKQYLESALHAHKVLRSLLRQIHFLLLRRTNPAHPGGRQTRQAHPGGG